MACLDCAFRLGAVFELAKTQSSWTIFLLAGLAPVYLLYCVLFLMFSSSAMRKNYKSAARTLTNCHLEFEDEGCLWNVPEETNGRLYWKTYSSWMESKMAFALIREGLVYPIPKSALSSNQLVELRELFIKHLGPEAP